MKATTTFSAAVPATAKAARASATALCLLALGLGLGACGDGSSASKEGVSFDEVKVGACGAPAADSVFVSRFKVGVCNAEHAMEVAGRFELTDDDYAEYPGVTELMLAMYDRCQAQFEAFVGIPFWDSTYDLTTVTPSAGTWALGDRTVVCLVKDIDGEPLTSPARLSRR